MEGDTGDPGLNHLENGNTKKTSLDLSRETQLGLVVVEED